MSHLYRLLLIDDDDAHSTAFRGVLLTAKDGPFEGAWIRPLRSSTERFARFLIGSAYSGRVIA
jgi:hypothetical protein